MITLSIESTNYNALLTSYAEKITKVKDSANSFTAADGKRETVYLAYKVDLPLRITGLSSEQANTLESNLRQDRITATYNGSEKIFSCDEYTKSIFWNSKTGISWDFSFTLSEV